VINPRSNIFSSPDRSHPAWPGPSLNLDYFNCYEILNSSPSIEKERGVGTGSFHSAQDGTLHYLEAAANMSLIVAQIEHLLRVAQRLRESIKITGDEVEEIANNG